MIEKLSTDISNSGVLKTNVKVEKGYQAVINMMEDRLALESQLIRERWYTGHPHIKTKKYEEYVREFAKRRAEKRIFLRGLYSRADLDRQYPELMETSTQHHKEVRLWPEELADTRHLFTIYGDKVAFIAPKHEDLVVLTIQEQILADLMRSMFDFIWSRSQKLPKVQK